MSVASLINRPCTIERSVDGEGRDRFNNPVETDETIETLCELQKASVREGGDDADLSDAEWKCFFRAGEQIKAGDSVVIDGARYEVVGAPWPAELPQTGVVNHVEVELRRVSGAGE